MIKRFYYTFNELKNSSIIGSFAEFFRIWNISFTDSTKTNVLFTDITEKYGDDYMFYLDIESPSWEIIEKPSVNTILYDSPELLSETRKELRKVKSWLNDSRFRYETLIDLYDNQTAHLLDKISAITKTQFNDTPQTTIDGLDGDEFATTYTVNTASSDPGTVMQRLNEVRNSWNSVYHEWCSEFGAKFVIYN